MVHLDHIVLATQDLYEASFRLRKETGFGFYDGGWTDAGVGSKIFPLGPATYIQLSSLVNPFALADAAKPAAKRFYDSVAGGDRFTSFNLRVDTMEELQQIAQQHNFKAPVVNTSGGRMRPDGQRIVTSGVPSAADNPPAGMPMWYHFPEFSSHPSGQPVEPAPGLLKPLGVAWAEIGGTEADMTKWLGMPASNLPFRFNGKALGIYAIGVKTDKGEVVIRRKSMSEA
jgi:hypothetical protein